MPRIATIERQVTETTDIELIDLSLHFADEGTPPEAGGPGALVITARGAGISAAISADDPLVKGLLARLTGELAKLPGARRPQ